MKRLAIILWAIGFAIPLQAQNQEIPSPIIFIYDASGSMWGQMQGKTKMEIASQVLSNSVNALPKNQKIGLVAYGHRRKGDCTDVEFLVDITNGTKLEVNTKLRSIKPLGKTPLAYSATLVIDQLRALKAKATIILVTDGIESCNGDLCDIISSAKVEGIDFKLHIVGFGLKDSETQPLKCAANAGDGQYYDAADADGLGEVLNQATSETIDDPAGNFSVFAIKNGKPIDAYIKAYKSGNKLEATASRTYADTSYMYLPTGKFDIVATPLGGSDVKAITINNVQNNEESMDHITVSFDSGKLKVMTTNNGVGWDAIVKVRDSDGKAIAQARTYGRAKDLDINPGTYNIDFQALVMEGLETFFTIKDVTVGAAETVELKHEFETAKAKIMVKSGGQNIDAVVKVMEITTGTNVAASRSYDRGCEFLLNPGSYTVKVSPIGVHKDKASQLIPLKIKKGDTVEHTLSF